jgi:hypothetical protein
MLTSRTPMTSQLTLREAVLSAARLPKTARSPVRSRPCEETILKRFLSALMHVLGTWSV